MYLNLKKSLKKLASNHKKYYAMSDLPNSYILGSETEESPSPIQEFETGVSISPIQAYESKMSKSTLQESKAEEPQHKDNSIDNLLLDPKMAITARLHSVSPSARFGLHQNLQSAEDKLLAKIIEDMCYLAGALFHTAAKILNKALHLAGIPQGNFCYSYK